MEEFEIKFLEIDVPEIEKKLVALGAKKVGEYNYSRVLFDYPDMRMNENHGWVRVRTDGKETTFTYKQRLGVKSDDGSIPDEGMKEIEVFVSDYQKTCEILKSIGLIVKVEEKNKRIRYEKGDTVFDIDFWPQIPPYLEIESVSLALAQNAAKELGLDLKDGMMCSAKQIYKKYGINKEEYSLISFEGMIKKALT